jgi:hypothetical protein
VDCNNFVYINIVRQFDVSLSAVQMLLQFSRSAVLPLPMANIFMKTSGVKKSRSRVSKLG